MEIVREGHLAEKVVFIDGLWGCGKTMLSPIIAAFDRVELLSYSHEIEYTCSLYHLGKITEDAAIASIRMFSDLKLYNTMMSRDTNFRFGDLSSIFSDAKPLRYFLRAFQKGDEHIPEKIKKEKPILHLTTHNLIAFSEPVCKALGNRVVFIELVRHPLYMIKQQALNMERLVQSPRDFSLYYDHGGHSIPYYAYGWEDLFLSGSSVDKAIHYVDQITQLTESKKQMLKELGVQILTISFESFVVDPWKNIKEIERMLGTRFTFTTKRMMKKQKVPRKIISDGVGLKIYKRCGWEPPKTSSNMGELTIRREYTATHASKESMLVLDRLCAKYEDQYVSVGRG